MIINIIYVHDECCFSQMNIKLLSLNEENENFEHTSWTHNIFGDRKNWGSAANTNVERLYVRMVNVT